MDRRPKRRKDKYNPYTLHKENERYYVSFIDSNNKFQKIEISQEVFESFNKFELEDVSQMNEYDRHLEHSEVDENTLYQKSVSSEQPLEEYFENVQVTENLHIAISKLPEVQKRRLNKYYFEEKTFDEIALEEGCTYQCVQRSVYRAVEKIKNILKNKLYCGYMISGGIESPYIERLQIIDENVFEQAQYILNQRSNKNEEKKQIARTTKGSTLLSGNIYCAHCGQKMVSTSYIDKYDRADGSQYKVRRQRYICTNKAMKRGACDGQSAYVAHRIDGAVLETLRDYLAKIKSTPKDIALEKRYKLEISEYKRKQTKIDKLKRQVIELSAEIGRSLLGESRFTPDILSTSIDNTNDLLHKKEIELSDIKYKLANQQNAMSRLDFYYSQFRTCADEFDNSTMELKKMIDCQLIREVKVSRGYELEIIFELNYEQFLSL